ncbi:hypothetical protein HAX54_044095 [Datura stramonium]|uniref:Protein FAR1-RELATED SEQUENCE n=1 Tax=Datura stramonium TaxID=4076 RepID=A0ABS8W2A8_DATST|nr:hypothetical protein [Datura stramonium]
MDEVKRKLEPAVDVVLTIKLYRTPAVETPGYGSSDERRAVSSQRLMAPHSLGCSFLLVGMKKLRGQGRLGYREHGYRVGEVGESEVFHEVLYNTVYSSLKVDEFEVAWEDMTQQFGCRGYGWLQSLYEDRERWAPIYMKDKILAEYILLTAVKEVLCDLESREFSLPYEQGIAQINSGPIITYIVKELRHASSVLNYNGIEEIPNHYILTRWRKDFKRLYAPKLGSNNIDISNPVQWFDHLHRRAMQVVDEGMTSQDHYMVAWQAFKESLNKVRLAADKHVS